MLFSLLLALAAVAGASCSVPADESTRQAQLAYSAFDSQTGPYGWRGLSGRGCVESAVSLLASYEASNISRVTAPEAMELAFHIGQVLALSGREQESIAHFERALGATATTEWRTYVEATLAFLRRDTVALKTAHDRYAAVAPGSMRLRFIKGYIACPDDPYAKAVHCGM